MRGGMVPGMAQIAIRLPDADLRRLDEAVARGRYPTRAAAVRAGVERLLRDEREAEIAEQYRRAYAAEPQVASDGRTGLALMAAAVRRDESPDPDPSTA